MPSANKSTTRTTDSKTVTNTSTKTTPKASPKAEKKAPKEKATVVAKETKAEKVAESVSTAKKVVYTDKQRNTALEEGRFNRVDGTKICGSLLMTGAEGTWSKRISQECDRSDLFIYNIDQRIAGKPKDVAEFYSNLLDDKPDRQKLVETAIKNSVSFINYDTTMRTEYEREIGRCQNAKLKLKSHKEQKTQSKKLDELEHAFESTKKTSDSKKKSKPVEKTTATSKTNTTK